MNGFNKCENGHFYKEDLSICPYCPTESGASNSVGGNDLNKTIVSGVGLVSGVTDNSKTEVFDNHKVSDSSNHEKVIINQDNGFVSQPKRDLNKTFISGITDEQTSGALKGSSIDSVPRSSRRIVGWVLSYSLDPMGVDYRIYEGNNSIGRDAGNSITITKDTTISGKHATVLYKKGKFYIKDEMAANGTFVNNEELDIDKPYPLNDGDSIRLANTTFIFKSSEKIALK